MRRLSFLLLLLASFTTWAGAPRELTWPELIPEGAPPPPPPTPLHDISALSDALNAESGPAVKQQTPHAPVVQALDGQEVKMPGYIVPLEVAEDGQTVRDFLLVPYYGACIHVPPPPSNQIVYVRGGKGVKVDELYQPFWIVGKLSVKAVESDLAEAGYQMQVSSIEPYEYTGE
ncbi:DUF3299 domain-containing protein [Pseudomonas sp. ZM23]|uniref:DUF3299 domain-containing protein n=1 Tax=Pseudomonas triclosanedens TaxID=2961893 RepID=A0ABY7A056_9PSED|nr:DUF3299 domain-containing protein [Pseudomonas triclosanedens]MCP8464124.1 DUF3299 domain-containing protein [Pseudomonas triclosanedens]MCP8469208.1 DUF3299 domain-containing protein [Pseudomonas triclosanedens]MCP8475930.1 DUF3299 domain-containing protein [Pseudomonas triclosanedens]WAI50371.1 DUF3299 domain-containing protein [Pseudomonas triclosanedens]